MFTGGPLAVTDANLILGRLLPEYFPKIFGKTEDQPLDKDATHAAFTALTKEVCTHARNLICFLFIGNLKILFCHLHIWKIHLECRKCMSFQVV